MSNNPTPAEVLRFMERQVQINEKLDENINAMRVDFSAKLAVIEAASVGAHEQGKKTNGRVTKLEKWQWMFTGALILSDLVLLPIVIDKVKDAL